MIVRSGGEIICKESEIIFRGQGLEIREQGSEIRGQGLEKHWLRFVVAPVPNSEAPGAPSFSGWIYFPRHPGHPPARRPND